MRASDAAREAFAVGWARATAEYCPLPLTERARVAVAAAMEIAEAQPQQAVNATLQLGQLEGIWAVIYARREAIDKLHAKALAEVLDAIAKLDWGSIIDRARIYLTLNPNLTGPALKQMLARDIVNLINSNLPSDVQAQWAAAMRQALLDATAEGQAAGMALAADPAGISIDFNVAATAAKDALANDQVLWDTSSTWIEKQTQGIGSDISRIIAKMWDAGATVDDIEAEIMDRLGVDQSTAGVLLDTAIGQALSVGAATTYQLAGVQYVDYITAGDGRVCAACGDAEDNSPYPLTDYPSPPIHVRCRCAVSPSDYQPTADVVSMLQQYSTDLTDEGDMAA